MSKTTRARDIMTRELIVGRTDITVGDAIKILVNNRITGFPIVDEQNHIVGVLSELDVIKSVESQDSFDPTVLTQVAPYSKKVRSILEDTRIQEVLRVFLEDKVRRLPVIDQEGHLKGIITRRDIMKMLFYQGWK